MSSYLINGNGKVFLTEGIKKVIREAKTYIKACNFLFQDKDIIQLLKEAAKRGVAIFIISNIRLQDYQEDSAGNNYGNDTTLPNLNDLKLLGCHVHLLKELHAKFIISDGEQGIIMSANFASNSINKNTETGVFVYEEELEDLEYVFEKLYLSSDITDIDRNEYRNILSKHVNYVKLDVTQHLKSGTKYTIRSTKADNNLYHSNVKTIYDSILEIIKGSKQYLYIVTWHFKAINELPGFLYEIKNAIKRGVKVVLYSNMYGSSPSLKTSIEEINKLKSLGCVVYGDDNNHSKCILSEKDGILFTANIDGKQGLLNGFEVGIKLTNEQRAIADNHIKDLVQASKDRKLNNKQKDKYGRNK